MNLEAATEYPQDPVSVTVADHSEDEVTLRIGCCG